VTIAIILAALKKAVGWVVKNWALVLSVVAVLAVVWLFDDWGDRGRLLEAERAARAGAEATANEWRTVAENQAANIRKLGEQTADYQMLLEDALAVATKVETRWIKVPAEVTVAVHDAPDCEAAVVKVGAILARMAEEGGAP